MPLYANLFKMAVTSCRDSFKRVLLAAALQTLGNFESLDYLVVENGPGLTREGLDQLQAALPECDLIRD